MFWIQSVYNFEVDQGVFVEPFVGTSLLDKVDDSKAAGGVRLSYSAANMTDSHITLELMASGQLFKTAADDTKLKYYGEAGVALYEIFNPTAVRVSIGGGVERRFGVFNPLAFYRLGAGGYLNDSFAIYADATFRHIFRNIRSGGQLSSPLDPTVSIHWIF